METVELIKYKDRMDLNEIYQNTQIQFAFVTESKAGVYKQETPFVLCRDFLHDALRAYATNGACHVYGFVFRSTYNNLDLKRTLMVVKLNQQGEHMSDYIDNVLHLLHLFEKRMKIKKTVACATQDPNIFLLKSSKSWQASSQFISLYTFLIRISATKNDKVRQDIGSANTFGTLMKQWRNNNYRTDSGGKDVSYLHPLGKYLQTIISNRSKLGLTFDKSIKNDKRPIHDYHHHSGIMTLCNKTLAGNTPSAKRKHEKLKELYMRKKKGRQRVVQK